MLVKKSIYLRLFNLSRTAFQLPRHLPRIVTLKPSTVWGCGVNRRKAEKVFHVFGIQPMVIFLSGLSQFCNFWLLLTVKSPLKSALKVSFWCLLGGFNDSHLPWSFSSMRWCSSCLRNCSSRKMMSTRRASVKLSPSFNGYASDGCLFMAVVIVLFTGLRRAQIRRKDERVIYDLGIQKSRSFRFA